VCVSLQKIVYEPTWALSRATHSGARLPPSLKRKTAPLVCGFSSDTNAVARLLERQATLLVNGPVQSLALLGAVSCHRQIGASPPNAICLQAIDESEHLRDQTFRCHLPRGFQSSHLPYKPTEAFGPLSGFSEFYLCVDSSSPYSRYSGALAGTPV